MSEKPEMASQPVGAARRGRTFDVVGLGAAVVTCAVLGFAAFAKLYEPNPKNVIFGDFLEDYVVAGFEIVVILGLLALHARKVVWMLTAALFAGFAGYSGYWNFSRGEPCGCFGQLWEPPQGVSVAIDLVLLLLALGMAWRFGARKTGLAGTLVACVLAVGAGAYYAYSKSPESFEGEVVVEETPEGERVARELTPAETLWRCELMSDSRQAHENGELLATFVFVYEVGCSTCEMYKPDMEYHQLMLEENDDLFLNVVMVSTDEAEAQCGIPLHAWEPAPIVFAFREGEFVEDRFRYSGEETPFDIVQRVYEWVAGSPYPY